jgi:hypothetical protein
MVRSSLVLLAALAFPAAAAADPPSDAIATARYGDAQVWLQRTSPTSKTRELVFQASASATPRTLAVTVPPHAHFQSPWAENLALGLDRPGRLTVVMQTNRGLYWTHVAGTPRLHHVPSTTKDDTFPSLFRGALAFGRRHGFKSELRVGSLATGRVHTVWTSRPDNEWAAEDTAIGAHGAIAFVTVRDGAGNGGYQLRLIRAGGRLSTLLNVGLGDTHTGGISITGMSTNGRRVTAERDFDSSSVDVTYALPSGKKL